MAEYGFAAMRPSDRSYAITLHENLEAIEQWRATLPDKQRRRLRGAQQNVTHKRHQKIRLIAPLTFSHAPKSAAPFGGSIK